MTTTGHHPIVQQPTSMAPGLGWAVASAASFGLSGSLAKSLLEIGWTPGAVVLARTGGACVALLLPCLVVLRRSGLPTGRQAVRLLSYGVVAVALAQICYFSAVQRLTVGTALLLEYLAPVLLIGWAWARTGTRPARQVVLGAVIAMTGMVLVLDIAHGLTLDPVGVLWGLGAAVCLCAYFLLSDHSGSDGSVSPVLMTTVGTGVGSLAVLAAGGIGFLPLTATLRDTTLAGSTVSWWVPVLLLVLVTATFAYVSGIVAVRTLGSSAASFVSLSEVIFAVLFAIVLLGQQPSAGQFVGGVLVLAGIATVQLRSASRRGGGPPQGPPSSKDPVSQAGAPSR